MIIESYVWKKELKKDLRVFERYLNNLDINSDYNGELLNLKFEKFFFNSAFIIRKLMESCKLSDEILATKINCLKYKRIPRHLKRYDYLSALWEIDKEYDLDSEQICQLSLREICNYFIHSFIFQSIMDENKLEGIFINSEYLKDKFCFYIKFEDYKKIILEVCDDYIVSMSRTYDKNTHKYIMKQSKFQLP